MNVVHKPTPLSQEGSFEPIVNARTAQRKRDQAAQQTVIHANERQQKLRKLRFRANAFGIASIFTIGLGFAGLLVDWIALPAALVLLCLCCIFGGWNLGAMRR